MDDIISRTWFYIRTEGDMKVQVGIFMFKTRVRQSSLLPAKILGSYER